MPFEPVSPLGGFTGIAEPREPERFTDVNPETRPFQQTPSVMDAAFRTENTVGSSVASEEVRYRREAQGVFGAPVKIDPDYDPWSDIVDTRYETYADKFALAGNRDHANAIKADIDRETKDRDTIAKSGWTGIGASMAAGVLDLPIFLPGGNLVRTAKGGVSLLRTAGSTAAYGTAAAIASETALHGSQQLRTGEESAVVIGGSTVLAGLLGAGFGKLFSRAEQAAFAARVEKDFTIPGHGEPDHYTPGGVQVDAAPGASAKATSVADIIRQTAEEILPPQVRVQVADKIDLAGGGKFAARPVSDQDRLLASAAWQPDRETFGQMLGDDLPRGRQHYEGEALNVYDRMAENITVTKQAADAGDSAGAKSALGSALHDAAELERLAPGPRTKLYTQFVKQAGRRHGVEALSPEAKAAQESKYAIRAFHGTPHDVDEFDLSKIGTGEGAQAFGHGLYFAESEGVASHYKKVLGQQSNPYAASSLKDINDTVNWIKGGKQGKAPRKAQQYIDDAISDLESDYINGPFRNPSDAQIAKHLEGTLGSRGNLYEVELDVEPHQLLDWDKPLSQQSPEVQKALRKAGFDVSSGGTGEQLLRGWSEHPELRKIRPEYDRLIEQKWGNPMGETVSPAWTEKQQAKLSRLEEKITYLSDEAPNPEVVSKALREAGVPGIRYLDQGSRDAGEGTRNIVIFDDKLVKITKKNGDPATKAERKAITDEMFGVRKEGVDTVAEGRYDPQQNLITISADALDPVKTLKHESIHALRTMNLFTDKEWGTLEAAARKQGWVESNNVRALYEELYSGKAGGEAFSLRGGQTETPEFKNWFGESKVVADDGKPLRVYHGTDEAFEAFDKGKVGSNFELDRIGFFFSDDADTANRSRKSYPKKSKFSFSDEDKLAAKGGRVIEAYVRIERPLRPKDVPGWKNSMGTSAVNLYDLNREAIEAALRSGDYDGVIIKAEGRRIIAPLEPTQIKSVDNRGTFDPSDPRIQYSVRGEGKASTGPLDPKLENLLIEEAIAEQFSLWRQGAIQVTGAVAKLFQRIKDFLDRVGNALRGQGFQTADDVFASVRGGDVAGRAAPTVAPGLPGGAALASGGARSVGAAAREAVDNTLKPALGLEKVRVDPLIYLQNSKSEKARTYIQELAETPLAYKKNAQGMETAPLGSEMGEPGSVESRIKMWQAPLAEGVQTLENAFMRYRKGRDAQMFDQMRTTVGDALSKPEKLTWRQFKEEVAKAARRGDAHEIPEVAQAAKFARESVFNPLKERAIDKELLPEDISVETAESYLNRMYNKEKIIARRPEFKGIVENWLDEVEFRNGVTRAQLSPLLRRLDKLQEAAKKEAAKPKTASSEAKTEKPKGKNLGETLTDTHIISLIDGKKYKELKRHIEKNGMTVDEYRSKFGLSAEYPTVHPSAVYSDIIQNARKAGQKSRVAQFEKKITDQVAELKERFRSETTAEKGPAEIAAEKAAADKAETADLQQQIEELVLKYEGKTKAEAESAIKAREKAEIGRDPAAKRLTAADKPIIRAAKKIAAQVDKEAGETASLADEIIDRVLGTPDGRLPYDAHLNRTTDAQGVSSSARGPLAARTFMIPDALIEDFLENDFEMLMNAYVRTMAPDIELHARFGDVDMKLQMKEIQDEWARINSRATSEKERRSLDAQKNGDIRRLAAIRDRLRGTYKLPDNPDGMLLRAGRVMRSVNYMAMLGGQVASAIPDMGSIVFSHGIMRTFGDGIIPLFRNFSGARMAMREVKLAGTALDMELDTRAMNIGEMMDDYGRHTKFERSVQSLTRNFGPVSLMSPWNTGVKRITGMITMTRIIQASDALKRGVIKKPDLERLAASGISRENAIKIAEQFKKHGVKDRGVFRANTENWDREARSAKEAFRVALAREVDKTIITPGQEKWLWMSTELGKTLGQFKSFSVSANQRLLIAGLQQRDMGTLSGAALMVALGGLVHILKTKAGGHDPGIDWSDNEKTSQFMVNAVDRSGLLGWLMEANAVSEKVTGGQVGLSKLTGRPVSRYASRNAVGSLFGPTFGTLQSIGQVSSSGFTEWKETDTRAARRLIPYQNLFYMRSLFDKAEEGVNSYFGVPKTATRR